MRAALVMAGEGSTSQAGVPSLPRQGTTLLPRSPATWAPSPSAHLPSTQQTFTASFSKQTSASQCLPRGQGEPFGFEFSRRKGFGQQHCSLAQRTAMRHQAAHEVGYSDPSPLREKDACVPQTWEKGQRLLL